MEHKPCEKSWLVTLRVHSIDLSQNMQTGSGMVCAGMWWLHVSFRCSLMTALAQLCHRFNNKLGQSVQTVLELYWSLLPSANSSNSLEHAWVLRLHVSPDYCKQGCPGSIHWNDIQIQTDCIMRKNLEALEPSGWIILMSALARPIDNLGKS